MLQHNPRHVSSRTLLIFRRTVLLQPLVSSLSVNGRTVCRLRALNRHTVRLFTESDDTRGCNNTTCPPEDGQGTARNMLRIML